jgi:hypothetical protein
MSDFTSPDPVQEIDRVQDWQPKQDDSDFSE